MDISEDYVLELQRRITSLEGDLARSEAEADRLHADLCLAQTELERSAALIEGYERLTREPWLLVAVGDIPTPHPAAKAWCFLAGDVVCLVGLIRGVIVRCGVVDGFVSLPQAAMAIPTEGL